MNDKFKTRDRRADRRYFIDNAFLKCWGAKLGPHCIAVYNVLVMYANADDQTSYPSFKTIAELTGMSRRQVIREIEKLKANKIIRVDERIEINQESGKPQSLTNIFTLLHPDEWVKIEGCLHEPSDTQSLGVGTDSHQPDDTQSPPLVTPSHPNNTHINKTQITKPKEAQNARPHPIPAYQIFYEETGKFCLNKAQIKAIEETVGTDPPALEKWRESVRAWNLQGNKLTNAGGMLDWYHSGKRSNYEPKNGATKNGQHSKPNQKPTGLTGAALDDQPVYDIYTDEYLYPDGHREPANGLS